MKKLLCLFLSCFLLISLVSCKNNRYGDSAEPSAATDSKSENRFVPNTEREEEPNGESPLYRVYADALPAPISPALEKGSCQFGERTLLLEDPAENRPEQLVAEYHYYQLSAEPKKISKLLGKTEMMQAHLTGIEQEYKEGISPIKCTVYRLNTLTKEDIAAANPYQKQKLLDMIRALQIEEYAVICAEVSYIYPADIPPMDPGPIPGRHAEYFLSAVIKDNPEWKLYARGMEFVRSTGSSQPSV